MEKCGISFGERESIKRKIIGITLMNNNIDNWEANVWVKTFCAYSAAVILLTFF